MMMNYQQILEKAANVLGQGFDYMWPKIVQYAFVSSLFRSTIGFLLVGFAMFLAYKGLKHKPENYRGYTQFVYCLFGAMFGFFGCLLVTANIVGIFVPEVAALKMILGEAK